MMMALSVAGKSTEKRSAEPSPQFSTLSACASNPHCKGGKICCNGQCTSPVNCSKMKRSAEPSPQFVSLSSCSRDSNCKLGKCCGSNGQCSAAACSKCNVDKDCPGEQCCERFGNRCGLQFCNAVPKCNVDIDCPGTQCCKRFGNTCSDEFCID